jgi:hypothetical protein
MKRMTQILSLGLLLSISSVALAGGGNGRNDHDGYNGEQYRNTHQNDRYDDRHNDRKGHRHYVNNNRHARRHSHQGHYCNNWHPRGYVAPRMHYGYSSSGLVIVYQPNAGLYIGGGR